MKCRKCGTEYENAILCPNCDAETTKQGKLLGFRTNKPWKKALSIIYMVVTGFYILGSISSIASTNDAVNLIQQLLFAIAPYIFLSNFKLRNILPLFKKHKKGLSCLGMIFVYFAIIVLCIIINPTTYCEHNWVETENVVATCTEDGYIKSHCDLCNSDNTEYLSKGHKFVDATCEQPSVCNGCGETKDSALGHTTDCGICTRCLKEFRKNSPVTILDWTYDIDYFGGVEWCFQIKNNTDKQIKYVTMQWNCYNAVGDLIYDEITRHSYVRLKFTGPLDAHTTSNNLRNTEKFYNYNLKSYKMTEVVVEYMDGTTEKLTNYHDNLLG